MTFDAGIGISVGRNTFYETGSPISVLAHRNLRYKVPSVRLRGGLHKGVTDHIDLGFESGIIVHYLETYHGQKYRTTFSVPVLLLATIHAKNKPKHGYLFGTAGFGAHFTKVDAYNFTDRGGLLIKADIGYKTKMTKKYRTYYKLGFERQYDNVVVRFIHPGEESHYVHYRQNRNQVVAAIGIML